MTRWSFKKIDAFATADSSGNPAGVVYLESLQDMSTDDMRRIAGEMQGFVSEVGYVAPLDDETVALRYYSSEREVEFCGHATIAIMYDLITHDEGFRRKDRLYIVNNMGKLPVENRVSQEDAVFIMAPSPTVTPVTLTNAQIAGALELASEAIPADVSVARINAGLETLLVPIRDLNTILSLVPEMENLRRFCVEHAIDIITVFTDDVADHHNGFRTRVFAPTFGYLEDPATGSGNAAFGYYLLQQQRWDGAVMSIEQNGSRERPNIVKLMTREDEKGEQRVLFGGGAIVRIDGEYLLS
jgi:PhzF family phenazine biosynthesis protein